MPGTDVFTADFCAEFLIIVVQRPSPQSWMDAILTNVIGSPLPTLAHKARRPAR